MTGKELAIRSLGVAGIIIALLLLLSKFLTGSHHKEIKTHFRNAIAYTNSYEFDKATKELDAIINHPKATDDDKEMANLMKKIVDSLKQNPSNTQLLDNLNDLSTQSGILSKGEVEKIKAKGDSSPKKQAVIRKQDILDELTALSRITPKDDQERALIESKREQLLNELRGILDQEGNPKTNALNDASQYYASEIKKVNDQKAKVQEEKLKKEQQELLAKRRAAQKARALAKKRAQDEAAARKRAAEEIAKRQAAQKAAQDQANRLAAQKAAQDEANRLAAQKAAQDEANRLAAQKAAQDEANRLAAQKAAQDEANRLAAQKAAQDQANRLAAQKAAQDQANRLAAQKAAQDQANRLAAQKAAQDQANRQALETANKFNSLKTAAYDSISKEQYDQAQGFLNQAQQIQPNSDEIAALKSLTFLRQGNKQAAIQELAKAKSLDKGHFTVPLVQGEIDYKDGKEAESAADYAQSNQRANNALANYRLGTMALKNKEPQKALGYYNAAYTSPDKKYLENSFHTRLAYNMGNSYIGLKQPNKAVGLYNEALSHDENYNSARISLAQIYYAQKRFTQALKELNTAYKKDAKNYFILTLLGKTYHSSEDYAKSEQFFQQAVNLKPQDSLSLYNLGTAQIENGNYKKAQANLSKSLQLSPNNQVKAQLGLAYLKDNNINQANSLFQEVLAQEPSNILALKGMGDLLSQQKQYPQAISYLQKAAQISPSSADIYYKMGTIYFQQKNMDQSINFFTQAYNLEGSSENALQLANVYFANDDLTNADQFYDASYKKKRNPEALEGKANIAIKNKDFPKALEQLQLTLKQFPNYIYKNRVNTKMRNIQNINAINQVQANSQNQAA